MALILFSCKTSSQKFLKIMFSVNSNYLICKCHQEALVNCLLCGNPVSVVLLLLMGMLLKFASIIYLPNGTRVCIKKRICKKLICFLIYFEVKKCIFIYFSMHIKREKKLKQFILSLTTSENQNELLHDYFNSRW